MGGETGGIAADRGLRRLLRALSMDGALLVRMPAPGDAGGYALIDRRAGARAAPVKIGAALAEACLRHDLLAPAGEGWRLSGAGRQALKRLLAGAEPYQEQHQQRVRQSRQIEGDETEVLVNDAATPLGWLHRRKDAQGQPLISAAEYAAGERLARDFAFAGLTPRITSSWSGGSVSSASRQARSMPAEMSDNRLAARQRVHHALDAVGGSLADLLIDVCCLQQGLPDAETAHGWPRRSGRIILRLALERLARHYGLLSEGARQHASGHLQHWGASDYRPRIGGDG